MRPVLASIAADRDLRSESDPHLPMSVRPLPHHACPLCGEENGCAVAASGRFDTPCWCQDVAIGPETLARVPPAQRNRACLCRRCAGQLDDTPE